MTGPGCLRLLLVVLAASLSAMGLPAGAAPSLSRQQLPESPAFDPARYNPAVLRIGFSEKGAVAGASATSALLDLTLIPAEGEVQGYRLEVPLARFNNLLRQLYGQLAKQAPMDVNDPSSPARQLYDILLKPVTPDLERLGVTTLLLSADAGLQAVPYAALHDGRTYFGERYALGLTPALGLTRLDAVPTLVKARTLASGASVFRGLAPLPLVPQELERLESASAADRFLNQTFTPSVLLERAGDPAFQRVHVATHAEFLPGGPAKARLQTGTAPMGLRELSQLRQRRGDTQLDVFTLSACRTALGDPDTELGFAGLALQAGSRSAIGSLWYVDDVATSALMVQFYRYLDQGIPKAEALQLTRQAMASGRMRLEGDRVLGADNSVLLSALTPAEQRRISAGLQHPFFWSGINLLGNPW